MDITTKEMDAKTYAAQLRLKDTSAVEFTANDAMEAYTANPDNPNRPYYLQEVHLATAELLKRESFEMENLDDEESLIDFMVDYDKLSDIDTADKLGLYGPNRVLDAASLSAYSWNKKNAIRNRKSGMITLSKRYEDVADKNYDALSDWHKW